MSIFETTSVRRSAAICFALIASLGLQTALEAGWNPFVRRDPHTGKRTIWVPFVRVETGPNGTKVKAPFTRIESGPQGNSIRAPFYRNGYRGVIPQPHPAIPGRQLLPTPAPTGIVRVTISSKASVILPRRKATVGEPPATSPANGGGINLGNPSAGPGISLGDPSLAPGILPGDPTETLNEKPEATLPPVPGRVIPDKTSSPNANLQPTPDATVTRKTPSTTNTRPVGKGSGDGPSAVLVIPMKDNPAPPEIRVAVIPATTENRKMQTSTSSDGTSYYLHPIPFKETDNWYEPHAGLHIFAFIHPHTGETVGVPIDFPEGEPEVQIRRDKVEFDYGREEIEVHFRKDGRIEVEFDD